MIWSRLASEVTTHGGTEMHIIIIITIIILLTGPGLITKTSADCCSIIFTQQMCNQQCQLTEGNNAVIHFSLRQTVVCNSARDSFS